MITIKKAAGVAVMGMTLALSGMAASDAAADGHGEKVWKKCKACHTIKEGGKNKVGPNLHGIVGEGNVYETILKMADKIGSDLIVMASHRPELQDYLLGPNAARVVRHAKCSVLVVRGK